MKTTLMAMLLVPAVLSAQAKPDTAKKAAAHDHAKMMAEMEKKADTTAMKHDMATMKHDSTMKHDMSGMKMDSGMKGMMGGMKGGMMGGMKGGMKGGMMDGKKGGTMGGMGGGMMQGMGGGMKSGWGQLDAFHTLLMSTWHPAEKDSLAMARSLAATVVAASEAWAGSKGPASCDNAALRAELPSIVANAKAYAGLAAKGSDADVKAALKKVHDGFEKVGEPCIHAAMQGKGGMMGMKGGMKHDMGAMDHDMSAMKKDTAAKAKTAKPAVKKP